MKFKFNFRFSLRCKKPKSDFQFRFSIFSARKETEFDFTLCSPLFYLLFIYFYLLFIIYLFISIALKKKKETDQLLEKTDINILFRFPLSCGIWEMHYKSFFVFGLWH